MPERTIPILPSRAINETRDFYRALGFEATFEQHAPAGYLVVQRGGIRLDFRAMPEVNPQHSYGACFIQAADVDALHKTFAAGLRAWLGMVPTAGIPRIGAPESTANGVRRFTVTDPAGNTLLFGQPLGRENTRGTTAEGPERTRAPGLR